MREMHSKVRIRKEYTSSICRSLSYSKITLNDMEKAIVEQFLRMVEEDGGLLIEKIEQRNVNPGGKFDTIAEAA